MSKRKELVASDADPTRASRKLTPADLPPSLQAELACYPEIVGIANAARQISDSLLAQRGWGDEDNEGDEAEDGGSVSTAPIHRVPDEDRPVLTPASRVPQVRDLDDDRPTLPLVREHPGPQVASDEDTLLRKLPGR